MFSSRAVHMILCNTINYANKLRLTQLPPIIYCTWYGGLDWSVIYGIKYVHCVLNNTLGGSKKVMKMAIIYWNLNEFSGCQDKDRVIILITKSLN